MNKKELSFGCLFALAIAILIGREDKIIFFSIFFAIMPGAYLLYSLPKWAYRNYQKGRLRMTNFVFITVLIELILIFGEVSTRTVISFPMIFLGSTGAVWAACKMYETHQKIEH